MPKKKSTESQEEQSKRFLKTVEELARDGELDPTEAEERFERALRKVSNIDRHKKGNINPHNGSDG